MQLEHHATDEELMQRIKAGQLRQATQLFARYQQPLLGYFLNLTYQRAESEDLVQNTFERLIRYRQSYQPNQAFRAWIFQIARNVRNDFYKKQQRQRTEDITDWSAILTDDAELNGQQRETQIQLRQAMQQLIPEQRELLILTRFQKMPYAEVAEVFDTSENAIKGRVMRAIQQLRKQYFLLENE
ncbi:MAG: RNA polymerase sigma factor [Saprospiraceae bacterium]